MYPWLLGSCGRNVVFGQNVVLRHPHKIHIADNVVIDDGCLLDAKGDANRGIQIGDGVFIGRNTILSCKNGDITLGDRANIGFNCEIFSAGDVRVGKDTLLAAYAYLVGGDHDFSDRSLAINEQPRGGRRASRSAPAPGSAPVRPCSTGSPLATARSSARAPSCGRSSRPVLRPSASPRGSWGAETPPRNGPHRRRHLRASAE